MAALAFIFKNRTLLLIGLVLLLLSLLTFFVHRAAVQKDIAFRWEQNYSAELVRFTDKSGADAITIQEAQLTLVELKDTKDSTINALYEEAKNLKNRNREILQLLSVKTEIQYDSIIIPIRDTLIIREEDTVQRYADYHDKWLDVTIAVQDDRLEVLEYTSRDEIIVIIGWHKDKRFFVSRWFERKKYDADIKSKNPNSRITHSVNVRITGKRGR